MNIRIILYILVSALLITVVNIRRMPARVEDKNNSPAEVSDTLKGFEASNDINKWIESNAVTAHQTVIKDSVTLKNNVSKDFKKFAKRSEILRIAKHAVSGIFKQAKASLKSGFEKIIKKNELS